MNIVWGVLSRVLILWLFISMLQSCSTSNTVTVPTYFHIDSVHFVPNASYPSYSNSANISAVWVYYNNNPVGVFDLPATFPVIATGSGVLSIAPAISVDGLNSNMAIYPFYRYDTFTFTAQPGKVITHIPQTTLYSNVKVKQLSTFRYNASFSQCGGTSGTALQIVKDPASEFNLGVPCGGIYMTHVGDSSIDSSNNAFVIDTLSSAFVELNYKSDVPFYLGLQANLTYGISSQPFYLAGIYPSSTWQKFYLNVGNVNNKLGGNSYLLYIKTTLPSGQGTGTLLLDNIQLISF
jgi:hypothetical protein